MGILFWILGFIIWHGAGVINWKFLTTAPTDGMTDGGIFPAIVGTFCLIAGSMVVAFPLGVMSAIYTTEYAGNGKIVRFIRIMTNNLGSIPSIIFGLFGMALFVNALGFGDSIIAGSFTLGLLALPLVIRTTEGGTQGRPRFVPHGQPRPRSHQTSDDMARGAAYGLPQYHDGPHSLHRTCVGRNGADTLHGGGLLPAQAADEHLRPGDGAPPTTFT